MSSLNAQAHVNVVVGTDTKGANQDVKNLDKSVIGLSASVHVLQDSFQGLFNLIKAGFSVGFEMQKEYERNLATLSTVMGTQVEAMGAMQNAIKQAVETPFHVPQVVAATKSYELFHKEFVELGIDLDSFLTKSGDQAAAFGRGVDDMAQALMAFAAGMPTARRRLLNFGITYDVTAREIKTASGRAEAWNQIMASMSKTTGEMSNQMATTSGLISNFGDVVEQTARRGVAPSFEIIDTELRRLVTTMQRLESEGKLAEWFQDLINPIRVVGEGIWDFVRGIIKLNEASGGIISFLTGAAGAAALVAVAVTSVVLGAKLLGKAMKDAFGTMAGMFKSLDSSGSMVFSKWKLIIGAIIAVSAIITAIIGAQRDYNEELALTRQAHQKWLTEQQRQTNTLGEMAARYRELSGLTVRTAAQERELEEVKKRIALLTKGDVKLTGDKISDTAQLVELERQISEQKEKQARIAAQEAAATARGELQTVEETGRDADSGVWRSSVAMSEEVVDMFGGDVTDAISYMNTLEAATFDAVGAYERLNEIQTLAETAERGGITTPELWDELDLAVEDYLTMLEGVSSLGDEELGTLGIDRSELEEVITLLGTGEATAFQLQIALNKINFKDIGLTAAQASEYMAALASAETAEEFARITEEFAAMGDEAAQTSAAFDLAGKATTVLTAGLYGTYEVSEDFAAAVLVAEDGYAKMATSVKETEANLKMMGETQTDVEGFFHDIGIINQDILGLLEGEAVVSTELLDLASDQERLAFDKLLLNLDLLTGDEKREALARIAAQNLEDQVAQAKHQVVLSQANYIWDNNRLQLLIRALELKDSGLTQGEAIDTVLREVWQQALEDAGVMFAELDALLETHDDKSAGRSSASAERAAKDYDAARDLLGIKREIQDIKAAGDSLADQMAQLALEQLREREDYERSIAEIKADQTAEQQAQTDLDAAVVANLREELHIREREAMLANFVDSNLAAPAATGLEAIDEQRLQDLESINAALKAQIELESTQQDLAEHTGFGGWRNTSEAGDEEARALMEEEGIRDIEVARSYVAARAQIEMDAADAVYAHKLALWQKEHEFQMKLAGMADGFIKQGLTGSIKGLEDAWGQAFDNLKNQLIELGITKLLSSLANLIFPGAGGIFEALFSKGSPVHGIKGVLGFATGGTIPASTYGQLIRAGEGGEAEDVVPHSKRGAYARGIRSMDNSTINNPAIGMQPGRSVTVNTGLAVMGLDQLDGYSREATAGSSAFTEDFVDDFAV